MNTTNKSIDKMLAELDLPKGTERFGPEGLVKQITKRLVEKALEAEMGASRLSKEGAKFEALFDPSQRYDTRNRRN